MFKVLENGTTPTRGSKYSACVDLYASEDVIIGAGETVMVGLGVCINNHSFKKIVSENFYYIEDNDLDFKQTMDKFLSTHYLQLMLRSSLGKKRLIIPNGVGVIDLDYKDEIKVLIYNPTIFNDFLGVITPIVSDVKIKKGDKIAQITLLEHKSYLFGIESDAVRDGGFGSTDK